MYLTKLVFLLFTMCCSCKYSETTFYQDKAGEIMRRPLITLIFT